MKQEVVSSSYNDFGKCVCANCTNKKCDVECSEALHVAVGIVEQEQNPCNTGCCNECIITTIYQNKQR